MVLDDLDKALQIAWKTLQLSVTIYGEIHPQTTKIFNKIGKI
jgi:hypothetical protein